MSKLNAKGQGQKKAVSHNGNTKGQVVHTTRDAWLIAATNLLFGKGSYYESFDESLKRLLKSQSDLVAKGDMNFIINGIVNTRKVFKMRTMPVVLTVQLASQLRNQKVSFDRMADLVYSVINRPDEITDMFAYSLSVFGEKRAIPRAILKGLARSFNKFDEYQFAKYNRKGKSVTFSDVIRITHPKPKDEVHAEILDKIMNESRPDDQKSDAGFLKVPYTWETELSKAGDIAKETGMDIEQVKSQVWTELLKSGKMGYMAMIRNARNIEKYCSSDNIKKYWVPVVSDATRVHKSGILPFQVAKAADHINDSRMKSAVYDALEAAFDNVQINNEDVWIILDVSCSMNGGWGWGSSSSTSPIESASLMTTALVRATRNSGRKCKVTAFSNSAKHVDVKADASFETIHRQIKAAVHGGGTNLQSALDKKSSLGFDPTAVFVMSDMQVNGLRSNSVDKHFSPNTMKFAYNFAAYESTPLAVVRGWNQLTGLSERVFDYIEITRNGQSLTKQFADIDYNETLDDNIGK